MICLDKMRSRLIEESRRKCENIGLNPDKKFIEVKITDWDLKNRKLRNEIFIDSAIPFIELLRDLISSSGSLFLLTDNEGCVLFIEGDEEILKKRKSAGIKEGVFLIEEYCGTTAVSIALRIKKPFYLSGEEYYLNIFKDGSCYAYPVHYNNEVIGCIVIVHTDKKYSPHTFGFVQAVGRLIEKEYKDKFERDFLHSICDSLNICAISTDKKGNVQWISKKGERITGLKIGDDIRSLFGEEVIIKEIRNEVYESKENIRFLIIKREVQDRFIFILEPLIEKEERINIGLYDFDDIVGLEDIKEKLRRICHSDVNILLIGETGTGKEMLAQVIHNNSERRKNNFVVVNSAAIPENLFESELFGHKKGAFTDAKEEKIGKIVFADKGTIFLDEIGDMSLGLQGKLLRVLEEGKVYPIGSNEGIDVDVRFIFATNRDLKKLIEKGRFREDLYHRISTYDIKIPPLRERKKDIIKLAEKIFEELKEKHKSFIVGFKKDALEKLISYDYPGNVRELKNIITKAYLNCRDEWITKDDIEIEGEEEISIEEKIQRYKAKLIYEEYKILNNNIKELSKRLNLSERQIYRYIKTFKNFKH